MKHRIEIIVAILVIATVTAIAATAGIGTVSVTSTETTVLAANAQRTWVILQNNSAADIYVKVDSSTNAVTTANGLKITAAGGSLSLDAGTAPVRNEIKAIVASGTNSLSYQWGN